MSQQQNEPWPDDPADELQYTFRMFEIIWEIACRQRAGRRERTVGVVNEIRNRLLRSAIQPVRQRPQLKLIRGGA